MALDLNDEQSSEISRAPSQNLLEEDEQNEQLIPKKTLPSEDCAQNKQRDLPSHEDVVLDMLELEQDRIAVSRKNDAINDETEGEKTVDEENDTG